MNPFNVTRLMTAVLATFTLAAVIESCRGCNTPHRTVLVCIDLPEEQKTPALNGIGFWGVPVIETCTNYDVLVTRGRPLLDHPYAQAYYSAPVITLVSGDVMCTTRHEFGHYLGYADSPAPWGVMSEEACTSF